MPFIKRINHHRPHAFYRAATPAGKVEEFPMFSLKKPGKVGESCKKEMFLLMQKLSYLIFFKKNTWLEREHEKISEPICN